MKPTTATLIRPRVNVFYWFVLAALPSIATSQVHAADHFVPASTETVNCATYNGGVKPGDTITLAAEDRGPLTIRNCKGTASQRVTVRNDPAGDRPTVIRRTAASSGGFVVTVTDCQYLTIDGTGKWQGAPAGSYCGAPDGRTGCGIIVTSEVLGDAPTSYVMLNGWTTKVTIRGIEVNGRFNEWSAGGQGFQQNDHSIKRSDHPEFWREDFIYEENFVHNVRNSGLYIGPNWSDGDVPLRDIIIRKNLVEDTGRDGIKLKSAIKGNNAVHHNVIRRTGLRNEEGMMGAGISVSDGGNSLHVNNNWVEATGVQGIQLYSLAVPSVHGPFHAEIYNNLVYDTGKLGGLSRGGHGITVGGADGAAEFVPDVHNNTVVKTSFYGITFNSNVRSGVARDNIVSQWNRDALLLGNNTNENNLTAEISSIRFVDPVSLDFELKDDSPARDAGLSTSDPPYDHRDVPRPQGVRHDQGAFEFVSGQSIPLPPPGIAVE